MRSIARSFCLVVSVIFLSSVAGAACERTLIAGSNKAIPATGKINESLLNNAVLIEVNYARCRSGLPALSSDSKLTRPATKHSKWMAKNSTLSHKSNVRGQNSTQNRIKNSGIKVKTGAENIIRMYRYQLTGGPFFVKNMATCDFADGKGNTLPPHSYASLAREASRQWIESPKHRENFMSNRMRMTATGAAVDPKGSHCGSIYLTQLFIG
ncbi:CAP domain-containing protein [Falsihalocynthiibacter sp. S25ZX9]|uniref:CAP domain-containing protein n=1 Tax=Falsihalocynthiibacter sp. S25ZX9 TaxID=3240870 RepID=UPI00350FBA1B